MALTRPDHELAGQRGLAPPSGIAARVQAGLTRLLPRWPGWQQLPRETRDTLFLLGVIAWTIAPHIGHLPAWCWLLSLAVLLWRARLALLNAALPERWVLVAVLVVAAGLTLWSHRTLLGKEPGVTLAVVLMALKTLELRARRDAFVVFFLGFFLILTHFLYSQSLAVALAMLVSVWGLLTALVLAHMPVGQPSLRQASSLAARTALLGAPIMVLLFVLFPRVGPLWGVPHDGLSSTGLSNSMRLGSLAEVAQDDSIALRLRFEGAVPPPETLYLRGPVLAQFDGVEWRPLRPVPSWPATSMAEVARLQTRGAGFHYTMSLEPLRLNVVPLLEASVDAPQLDGYRLAPREDLQWQADHPIVERLRLSAVAYPQFSYGPRRAEPALQAYGELPPGYNPRTLQWAAALRRELGTPLDAGRAADALLQHIRHGGYRYTLAAATYGRDAVDEFWLDRREGFCEHYAAAFVVIMRALGVPARVVTGYQGADPLPVDGWYLVRQSSAHAWAEYWQAGRGWVRADPTAAVAPDRISRSRRLVPVPGLIAEALGSVSPALLEQLRERRRPAVAADRRDEHPGHGSRRLGLVGPQPQRPVAAPGAAVASRAGCARHRGGRTRGAADPGHARAPAARRRRRGPRRSARRARTAALWPPGAGAARCVADAALHRRSASAAATRDDDRIIERSDSRTPPPVCRAARLSLPPTPCPEARRCRRPDRAV